MYYKWVTWNIETHDPDFKLGCGEWGVNLETQLVFTEQYVQIMRLPNEQITQLKWFMEKIRRENGELT